ncbi:MAG: putative nucleic acid-binding protein [Verrucomicrobiales bacterium]|jgi:predicted nucleic acid-binding protein
MELAWSYILDLENDANPYENRQTAIAAWKDLASKDTEETADIVAMANSLQSKDLKITDSLHLACAIALKCRCFFTTDDGILKKRAQISEIAVLNPVDYFTGNQP